VERKSLHELKICRRAPGTSHLLFVDDTLLFPKIKEEQALIIKEALQQYERSTGHLINPSKCSLMFDANCLQEDENKVKEILGIANVTTEDKYLGLPTPDGRMSKDKFQTMKGRLVKKFNNWVERNMSSGAKEVITKSLAQAMPTYTMSIFKLPAGLCDELTHIVRKF
jgi:hypothetical protein